MNKLSTCIILAASATSLLHADVLGEWNFNTGTTTAERLASSSLLAGVDSLSDFTFNDSFEDFGPGSVPNSDNDGIGFGGNNSEQVLFLHRAAFTGSNGTDLPDFPYSTFGNPGTTAGGGEDDAPVSFTLTAGANDVTVESITFSKVNLDALIVRIQEAGAARAATPATVGSAINEVRTNTAFLDAPTIVAAGTSKTFTLQFAGQFVDARHNMDFFQLNGTVAVPEPSSYVLIASMFALGAVALRRRCQS